MQRIADFAAKLDGVGEGEGKSSAKKVTRRYEVTLSRIEVVSGDQIGVGVDAQQPRLGRGASATAAF